MISQIELPNIFSHVPGIRHLSLVLAYMKKESPKVSDYMALVPRIQTAYSTIKSLKVEIKESRTWYGLSFGGRRGLDIKQREGKLTGLLFKGKCKDGRRIVVEMPTFLEIDDWMNGDLTFKDGRYETFWMNGVSAFVSWIAYTVISFERYIQPLKDLAS